MNTIKKDNLDIAIEKAANYFDKWNNITGIFVKHTSYYNECLDCIENAVKIGFMAASEIKNK